MREIKFRAWDGEKMFSCQDIRNLFACCDGEYFYGSCDDWGDIFDETIIFMQYTGLKDKNGKEIYEGDILAYPNPNIRPIIRFGIYDNEELYDEFEHGCGFYLEENGKCRNGMETDTSIIEVIGNIHQNPELVKKEA